MMKKLTYLLFALSLVTSTQVLAKTVSLVSPNGKLKFELKLTASDVSYKVLFGKQVLIDNSPIGFNFDSGEFGANLKMNKPTYRTGKETYELVVGKTKTVNSHYKEVTIPLVETTEMKRQIDVIVRAFDDGIAFRYQFPQQAGWQSYVMYDEYTGFHLAENAKATALFLPSYTSSHEGLYSQLRYSDIEDNQLIDMPLTFEYDNKVYLSIMEAAIVDYAGMYLAKEDGKMRGKLSPLPGQSKEKVKAALPHQTPWRVLSISDRLGDLIESNILTNLNEPCKIEDTSWLRTGKTTFGWWNGSVVPDTTFAAGNNFDTNKYYIDFASRNNLEFHNIYGYADQPWYVDDGYNFGEPGDNVDVTKAIKPIDMKKICDYAASKGVDIHVWVNWRALYPKLDEAYAQFEAWGVKGMMIDFMDRDDQEMIRIQEELLVKAAKYHLFVQFHGSSKPSGLHRTYPNEFTREGTLNHENYKWSDDRMGADHDIVMPFTRLLAGATDYHLGGFRSVPESKFKIHYTSPLVTSTRCHMLAMYVVLESYLGMVCDTPESYEGQGGFEFIRKVPTTWDEVKVTNASMNEYVSIARKKDNAWYIGAMNNSQARELAVSLHFLDDNREYTAEIYTDGNDVATNPNSLTKRITKVKKGDVINLSMAATGGSAVHIY